MNPIPIVRTKPGIRDFSLDLRIGHPLALGLLRTAEVRCEVTFDSEDDAREFARKVHELLTAE